MRPAIGLGDAREGSDDWTQGPIAAGSIGRKH